MIPWAVLITGAVGIGGTALGAWLNGRAQTKTLRVSLNAENERARLAEKRAIYARCNAAITRLDPIATSSEDRNTEPGRSNLANAQKGYFDMAAEAALIAPSQIRSLIAEITGLFVWGKGTFSDQDRKTAWHQKILTKRRELILAMRADLGEPD
jgi:hypothetical protein